jgi:nickel transport protein
MRRCFLALAGWPALLLLAPAAWAHGLKVFADRDGAAIVGHAYYAGGGASQQVPVRILTASGQIVATLTTDATGAFAWSPAEAVAYTVVVESADGHRATCAIAAAGGPAATSPELALPATSGGFTATAELEALVARAVASQVRPLREQLLLAEERRRLQDVVAGLGYVFGIMGVILFFKAARRRTPPPDRG